MLVDLSPDQLRLVRTSIQHYHASLLEAAGRTRQLSLNEADQQIIARAHEANDLIWLFSRITATPTPPLQPAQVTVLARSQGA